MSQVIFHVAQDVLSGSLVSRAGIARPRRGWRRTHQCWWCLPAPNRRGRSATEERERRGFVYPISIAEAKTAGALFGFPRRLGRTKERANFGVLHFLAQIRLDHAMIVADGLGRTLGDLFAMVEHGNDIAPCHDELHDMLDQDDG